MNEMNEVVKFETEDQEMILEYAIKALDEKVADAVLATAEVGMIHSMRVMRWFRGLYALEELSEMDQRRVGLIQMSMAE